MRRQLQPWDKPVARLAEGIDVIRLLWQAGEPVDFEGRFFSLRRAVLGLSPFGPGPPVWTAAHGPRMLELTGRKADGWLPTKMTPGQYQASLKAIEVAAPARPRRDPGLLPQGARGVRGARGPARSADKRRVYRWRTG